jgi:hypothetical protein
VRGPGYCALGGGYEATSGGYDLPFIDSEVNGTWGAAEAVPGRPVTRGNYGITAISCPGVGDCVAAGNDDNGSYTITQQGSGWSTAAAVSGLGWVEALSCPAVGRCVAGGATSFGYGGFAATATQRGGTWGKAVLVPGAKAYTYKGRHATSSEIQGLSCPADGYCVAGGDFFVSVTAHGSTPGAVPAGEVTVRAGSRTVCVIKLTPGTGKAAGGCGLTSRELKAGAYRVVATYPGSGPFQSSASAASVLTVA